jgi:prepilin-type processing-associated H-X9-DG protein
MLKEYCSVCNFADDGFIGISFQDGLPHVSFPRGYTLSEDDETVRKDILGLITVLQRFSNQREGNNRIGDGEDQVSFPILSYQYVIKDFIAHGYYSEHEIEHRLSDHGKINWKRTIQKKKPVVSGGNVVYLDFIVKSNQIKGASHKVYMVDGYYHIEWASSSSNWDSGKHVSHNRHGQGKGSNILFADGHVEYRKLLVTPKVGEQTGIDYYLDPTK